MSLEEAKTLQSQILFGSSECSCSSCESISCFAKRNRELNKCHCPTCQELRTCLYITKNKDANCYENLNVNATENPPCLVTKDSSVNTFKSNATRAKIENKNIVTIRLFKRNVIVQAKPQCCDKPIKNKCKEKLTSNENNDVREYSPITYIVNKVLTTYNDISLKDIIDKIKNVYKACSCKVCDCVANDINVCKCQPCECIECKSYLKDTDEEKINNVFNYYPVNNEVGETCNVYNRKNINDSLKLQNSACSCKPCDCELCRIYTIKVKDSLQSYVIKNPGAKEATSYKPKSSRNIENKRSETCSCQPCQCIVCKSSFNVPNKVVVGSVVAHLQSTECSCVPCDCADCRRAVPSTSPHPMRETSTDMAEATTCRCDLCFSNSCRQTRDTCGCESRNNVISKPFEKDTKDIDIHRALITKRKGKTDEIEQTCTISVLTKIIKDYKEREARKAKKSKSEDTNKCLKCNSKMRCSSSLCEKSHLSTHHVKKTEVIKCKCSPCECEICEKLKSVDNGVWKSVKFRSKCVCDVCRCIYCGGLLQSQNEADDDDQHKPQTSHCGKKSENTSTFTSHQSTYPALLYEYSPRPVSENVPINSNQYGSDNLFKYTCDDCIRMVNEDKNEIGQVHSELSDSFSSCHAIDEIKTNVEYVNQKELSNSYDSISWSFQEEQTRQSKSQLSLKNNMSESNQNAIQKQEVNEPCVFCGTFTLNSFRANTGNKEGMQIIRECFAKTNLALINNSDVNKKENENSILEDSDNDHLDENSQDSKEGEWNEFEYKEDYFEERSILFKAKLLTSELLKMLYEFQKANKDFDTFKNKSDIDHETNLEENQQGNIPHQELLQVLSLESKWNINRDIKLKENTTYLETCEEENVPFTNFKYSWSKTVLRQRECDKQNV
ncbi:uncharacterized protein LOC123721413 [Papilio machaon]|uniref:uncharacterized protein LOC123721413 n=1 Tax=Papilio machaon TaxID=76193 RepID=UPI001E665668|nr:uncharacterized protein LOC123721413 [Papilio machaon]